MVDVGGGGALNTLTSLQSRVSYHVCQTNFLHFLQKAEGWNRNQNTEHDAGHDARHHFN